MKLAVVVPPTQTNTPEFMAQAGVFPGYAAGLLMGIVALAIGIVVFTCSLIALRRVQMFGSGARFSLAGCTAALSVVGLMNMALPALMPTAETVPKPEASPEIEGILLPYTALGVTLNLLLLLLFLLMCWRRLKRLWTTRDGEAESRSATTMAHDELTKRGYGPGDLHKKKLTRTGRLRQESDL